MTELVARPLLNLYYPELSGLIQPFSGEYAGRREVLESVPFVSGYGVETGLLIDILDKYGVDAIAQVNLDTRIHANQTLESLGRMAFGVMQTVLNRLDRDKKIKMLADYGTVLNTIKHEGADYSVEPPAIGDRGTAADDHHARIPKEVQEKEGDMAVRVIYTDLDGTMMGPGGCLFKDAAGGWTYEAANALVEAMRAGVSVVIVSGRNRSQLREAARVMGIQDYISELGAEIAYGQGKEIIPLIGSFDASGKTVYEAIRDRGVIDDLFRQFGDTLEYHTPWSNEPRFYSHLLRGLVNVDHANTWLAENGHMDLKLVDNGQLASRANA